MNPVIEIFALLRDAAVLISFLGVLALIAGVVGKVL